MSLAYAQAPDRMTIRELAAEASKLRQRRFRTPAEDERLVEVAAELKKRNGRYV